MYDYLVVGAGLYGAVFAHEAKKHGKSVLVIDKRPNIAGRKTSRKEPHCPTLCAFRTPHTRETVPTFTPLNTYICKF